MTPKLITTHVYTKQPSGQCVWCKHPREMHATEYVRSEDGFKRVAIQPDRREPIQKQR